MCSARPKPDLLDRFALLVSAVCSPYVVLTTFIGLLASRVSGSAHEAIRWVAIAVAGVVLWPLLYIAVAIRRGSITDVHVSERSQRRGPFLVAIAGSAVSGWLLRWLQGPEELQLAAAAVVINGVLFTLISLRWKISIHPSVCMACIVMAGLLLSARWLWLLWLVPVVVWARVRRRRHDWAQGTVAVALAGVTTWAMVAWYLSQRGVVR